MTRRTPLLRPILIVFGGLPGTGKTTVAQALATKLKATYLRIDAIEQAVKSSGIGEVGAAGYVVGNALAEANLKLGGSVVADCVNPVSESRNGWEQVAGRSSAQLVEIEIVCSDPVEHRKRVEGRTADIPGHVLPTWEAVMNHVFEPWDGDHLVLDTANMPIADVGQRAEAYVLEHGAKASGVQTSL
jgi:predicted kinase